VFLGESLGLLGVFGILLVVVGSYVINLRQAGRDVFGPFRAMARESGTRLMVLVAFLFSLTSVLGKLLIQHSSPTYFAVHYAVVMSIVLAPAGFRKVAGPPTGRRPTLVILSGVFYSVMILFHMLALNTANVACMIALKRFSGVFGVIYGRLFFGERSVGHRLAGSVIMVVGGLLILLD
jgi:drug/metabolite transporter (DMT)-like permease